MRVVMSSDPWRYPGRLIDIWHFGHIFAFEQHRVKINEARDKYYQVSIKKEHYRVYTRDNKPRILQMMLFVPDILAELCRNDLERCGKRDYFNT